VPPELSGRVSGIKNNRVLYRGFPNSTSRQEENATLRSGYDEICEADSGKLETRIKACSDGASGGGTRL